MPRPVDEEAVLRLYESLTGLASGPEARASFDLLFDAVRRALVSPGGTTARTLLRAVTRYENVHKVIPDPEQGK